MICPRSTRRRFLATLAALLTASAMACSAEPTPTGSLDVAGEPGAFPVTIEHKFGATEITEEPERVVPIGYQGHDTLFALGVTPVAVRYWFGDESDVIFPWAEDVAAGADPEILDMVFGELSYEKIAALQPDIITAVYSGITQREYELLSQIAPTVAQTDEYIEFGVPWDAHTLTMGRALGLEERAQQLVADLGVLDTDLLVWDQLSYLPGGRATIEGHPVLGQLDAMRDGRALFLPEDLEYAFAFNSLLSLPYFLDGVVPMIEAATDGDPPSPGATAPDTSWSFTDDRQVTVTLSSAPQRLVMHHDVAGALMPFGVRPTAVFGNSTLRDNPQFEGVNINGIEEVGISFGEIDLEQIAALDPDVLLVPWSSSAPDDAGWMGFADENQLQLAEQLAPIVAIGVTDVAYSEMMHTSETSAARSPGRSGTAAR